MGKLSALRTGLGTTAETHNSASKTSCKIDDRNQLRKQFISSQVFHQTPGGRVREITAGEQFEPRNLESFDLVTYELYRYLPATIHNNPIIQTVEKIRSNEPDSREKLKLGRAGETTGLQQQ
jgi:hypothetical protein